MLTECEHGARDPRFKEAALNLWDDTAYSLTALDSEIQRPEFIIKHHAFSSEQGSFSFLLLNLLGWRWLAKTT